MAKSRTCIVDKTSYVYCPTCGKGDPAEKWRFSFCSENCRDLYNVCDNFACSRITAKEAKSKLSKLNLANRANFYPWIERDVTNITAATVEEVTETVAEPEIETVTVEEETKPLDEIVTTRKKKYKKNIVNED